MTLSLEGQIYIYIYLLFLMGVLLFLLSRHKGMVADVVDGTSTLSVVLDDGRQKFVELGKQGVRFVSQKQKRSKT